MGSYEVPARCADPRGYARVDHEACITSDPEPRPERRQIPRVRGVSLRQEILVARLGHGELAQARLEEARDLARHGRMIGDPRDGLCIYNI